MTAEITVERLLRALGNDGTDAGVTIRALLEPLAGPGAPVKPATYAGGQYARGKRWWDVGGERQIVETITIDGVPSQANRCEAALEANRTRLGIPEIVLDLDGLELPPHLPRRISSYRFPHRNADAYLRDAMLDGVPFPKTPVGEAIFAATADRSEALFEWMPHALVYGFWQSHLGKKRSQAKVARAWTSEIVGYRPADPEARVPGLKGDPLNLSVDDRAAFDENDLLGGGWELLVGRAKVGAGTKKEKLSEIGHGQVPFGDADAAPAGVSFDAVVQQATISFPRLRQLRIGSEEADSAGRALLAALALTAHVAAFGRAFTLRSGADLRPVETTWLWRGPGDDEPVAPLDFEAAVELLRGCVERAEAAGLPVGSRWTQEPLRLEPAPSLVKAIEATWVLPDED